MRNGQLILPGRGAVSYQERVRWEPVWNTTNETVPPFACMMLWKPKNFKPEKSYKNTDDEETGYAMHFTNGQFFWTINKCTEEAEELQQTSRFIFNSMYPIPPKSAGVGTSDFPCQAIAGGPRDVMELVGPSADKWSLAPVGSQSSSDAEGAERTAFRVLSTDPTNPLGQANRSRLTRTVWIDRGVGIRTAVWGQFKSNAQQAVSAGSHFVLPSGYSEAGILAGRHRGHQGIEIRQDHWEITTACPLLYVSFAATMHAAQAVARGTTLALSMYRKRELSGGAYHEPSVFCSREQNLEEDQYGNIIHLAKENVAMSMVVKNVEAGDKIYIKNVGSPTALLTFPHLSICQPDLASLFRAGIEEDAVLNEEPS